MKLQCRILEKLFVFRLVVGVIVAGTRSLDRFGVVQDSLEKIFNEIEKENVTDWARAVGHLVNVISNTGTSVQLPTARQSSSGDTTLIPDLYVRENTTPDVAVITEDVTVVDGNNDFTTETTMITQNDANVTDYTTLTTTEGFTDSTIDINTTPQYCPIDLKLQLINVTPTTISLEWLPLSAEKEPYLVNVHPVGPAYGIPPYCTPDGNNETNIRTFEHSLTFNNTRPKYTYSIFITTITICRTTAEGNITVTSAPMTPEAPELLRADVQDNGTTTFYWRLPCNLNGIPHYSSLSFYGRYSQNDTLIHSGTVNISASENISMYNIAQKMRLAFNYSVNVSLIVEPGIEGPASQIYFTTPDGVPGKPIFDQIYTTNSSITVSWRRPVEATGAIQDYELTFQPKGPLYHKSPNCEYDYEPESIVLSVKDTSYSFIKAHPYYEYQLLLRAYSTRGYGEYAVRTANTKESAPDNVQDVNVTILPPTQVEYDAKAQIHFKSCHPNGNITLYNITIFRNDNNKKTHIIDNYPYELSLQPNCHYRFMISTDNGFSRNETSWYSFNSTSGVPAVSANSMVVLREGATEAKVTLIKGYLNESNGEILYIALILSDENVTSGDFSSWDGEKWPTVQNPAAGKYYQITDDWWNPFKEKQEVEFTIGSGGVRNKPLEQDKEYYLVVRLFTSSFYRDSEVIYFKTVSGYGLTTGMLIGIVVGVLFMLTVFTVLHFIMRKKTTNSSKDRPYARIFSRKARNQVMKSFRGILGRPFGTFSSTPDERSTESSPSDAQGDLRKADAIKTFIEYYKTLEDDPDKLTSQFDTITRRGKEIVDEQTSSFARLSENWRKNRYVNILPYDSTRVKLMIDEDDEIASDYINASYIEGYTGKAEYIATQGPLAKTCRDFWKMVLQENVNEKCFKYFPEKGKIMIIGDDLEVTCMIELHFGTYCVRSIQVSKDNVQKTVTHMQFVEWPDFGVPLGTEHMLQFCYQVRHRINQEGGPVIVHCSAGVGRTGTFIATDILLQKANDKKPLDVFETVMKLREQRTLMVQTEEQFKYIHKLISDHLERPPSPDMVENSEHIYENLSVIQKNQESLDRIIVESSF